VGVRTDITRVNQMCLVSDNLFKVAHLLQGLTWVSFNLWQHFEVVVTSSTIIIKWSEK